MAKFVILHFQEGSGHLFWSLLCVFVIFTGEREKGQVTVVCHTMSLLRLLEF